MDQRLASKFKILFLALQTEARAATGGWDNGVMTWHGAILTETPLAFIGSQPIMKLKGE